jgi:uncharacterized membrane protein
LQGRRFAARCFKTFFGGLKNMLKNKNYSIILSGLFLAIGLILPYFTSHAFGVPGTILLPMHIPVLLCGLLCGPRLGALCGIVTPILSSVLTGMPPPYPMLPIMIVQLFALGLVTGLMYRKLNLNLYISLITAILVGWALYGLVLSILLFTADGPVTALIVPVAITRGIPGLIIQLTIIPATIAVLKRYAGRMFHDSYKSTEESAMLEKALKIIKDGEDGNPVSCVVVKDNKIIHTAYGRGVSPLLGVFTNESGKLKNAFVIDKIIGKAAAMILVSGGVQKVYGIVMSESEREYLEKHGVATGYTDCVDMIFNREGTDMCVIEKSVIDIDDSFEGLKVIGVMIDDLKKAAEPV